MVAATVVPASPKDASLGSGIGVATGGTEATELSPSEPPVGVDSGDVAAPGVAVVSMADPSGDVPSEDPDGLVASGLVAAGVASEDSAGDDDSGAGVLPSGVPVVPASSDPLTTPTRPPGSTTGIAEAPADLSAPPIKKCIGAMVFKLELGPPPSGVVSAGAGEVSAGVSVPSLGTGMGVSASGVVPAVVSWVPAGVASGNDRYVLSVCMMRNVRVHTCKRHRNTERYRNRNCRPARELCCTTFT